MCGACIRYNIQADLPVPMPPVLHPGTLQPVGPADLAPLFPDTLIEQEVAANIKYTYVLE
jgi:tryptophan synthase beta chain